MLRLLTARLGQGGIGEKQALPVDHIRSFVGGPMASPLIQGEPGRYNGTLGRWNGASRTKYRIAKLQGATRMKGLAPETD